jgi:hypothetical protein
MAQPLKTSNIDASLKETLDVVWGDEMKGALQWESMGFKVTSTTDKWVDDQEYAGLGLAQLTPEGGQIPLDSVQQGFSTRYTQVKFALGFVVSEEAKMFNKYDKAIDDTGNLARSMKWTQEYSAASIFINSASTSYVGGDGVALASASHPLAKGGTFSNTLSTPMSLSETAVETMRTNMRKLPSSNGLIRGYALKKLVVPEELWFRANRVLKSDQQNDTANNAVNVLKGMGIEIVSNSFLTSTTNWWGISDASNGLRWIWAKKPMFRSHNVEDNYTVRANGIMLFANGWTDPRGVYMSNI